MSKYKAIVVGTGAIAAAHAKCYQGDGNAKWRLAAAVDIDRDRATRFATEYEIGRVYDDLASALVSEKPDLVHICTPPALHARLSIQAMDGGANVICEKPLCSSLAELDAIQAAEERNRRRCAVMFQWRYGSGMRYAKRQINRGVAGRPLVAICNTVWYRDEGYYSIPWRGTWATELGGPTMGHGIHLMDSLLYLMGDWSEVTSHTATLDRDIEVEDVSAAIVRFENGAMATVMNSVLSPRQESYLRIDFQKGSLEATGLYELRNRDWRWTGLPESIDLGAAGAIEADRVTDEENRSESVWGAIPSEAAASHATVIEEVHGDIELNRQPLSGGTEARRTIEFLTAMYLSANERQPVTPEDVRSNPTFYRSVSGRE